MIPRKECWRKTPETLSTLKAIARILRIQEKPDEAEEIQFSVFTRLKEKHGLEHPETLRAMNELADLYMDSGKEVDAFQLSNETLIIELRIMGELDPMTLQTRYRIGKLHYLSDRKEEAMEELGDVLAKQEKILGFDHAEVTEPAIFLMKFFLNGPLLKFFWIKPDNWNSLTKIPKCIIS